MRTLISVFVLSGLFLFACHSTRDSEQASYFTLEGQLNNAPGQILVLHELTTSNLILLDSVKTDSTGFFSIRLPLEEAAFVVLRAHPASQLTLLAEPGEKIRIKGNANKLAHDHSIQGSPGSFLLSRLNNELLSNYEKVDSLAAIFQLRQNIDGFDTLHARLNRAYVSIVADQQKFVKDFIKNNPESLASIIALYQFFGNELLLKENEHFEFFESLSKSLSRRYPTNKHVLDLNRRVSRFKRDQLQREMAAASLTAGNPAPEVVLPNPEGEMIALSSLRGKVVLLDFWAAWSPPCREANVQLKSVYEKYRSKGFEIYGISLDRTHHQWTDGIREDGIDWIQVSDLGFWNSPVVSLYHVDEIPHSVLISPNGTIIQNGIRPGELERILSELLK